MHYRGIIITGNDETKVSAIAGKVCEKDNSFTQVEILTTRQHASGSSKSYFTHVTKEQFDKMAKEKNLLITIQSNTDFYGISQNTFQQVITNGKIPVIAAIPALIGELSKLDRKLAFLTIFLNNGTTDTKYSELCVYAIVNKDEDKTADLILELWEHRKSGGVLPQKLITLMIESGMLLENAKTSNATAAAYDLMLDDEYYHNGKINRLTEVDAFIKMEPGDYALVGSTEIANLPRDVAGRFGLSVSLFIQGVILSNGPQIDPGFKGRLYCLLFNTSSQQIQLKRGQHYATIEFNKLLEPTTSYQGKYLEKNKLSEYLPKDIPSSAIGELREDVRELKAEKLWIKILPLTISLLAILIAIYKLIT